MKKFKFGTLIAGLSMLAVPLVTHAQLGNIGDIVGEIGDIVGQATPILVGIAVLVFFWGLVKFIFNAGDPEERGKGKSIMIWGVVAIFVISALWGLVEFLAGALDVDTGGSIEFPEVPNL